MKTLEEIRNRIGSVKDMQSVVSTMKTLAAARIRQYEAAVNATRAYSDTVELALQILMRDKKTFNFEGFERQPKTRVGYVLLGSDQGFCGRFNEVVTRAAKESATREIHSETDSPVLLTVGTRLNQLCLGTGMEITNSLHVPRSVSDIHLVVQQIIPQLELWQRKFGVGRIDIVYNQRRSAAHYDTTQLQLIPLSDDILTQLAREKWKSRSLPVFPFPWQEMFVSVVRQFLFLQLFRACAESLASENASRIASMRQAEKNIEDRLHELNSQFGQIRQRTITEELLDIMSGFAAVTEK